MLFYDHPRIQARALKLGGYDVNLGLYIGVHNKRQDIITRMKLAQADLATHEHSPLNSDHSRVLSILQDSLASIYHSLAITRE